MKRALKYVAGVMLTAGMTGMFAAASAGAADMTASEKQLYDAAKKEGSVTWYVSQTTTEFADSMCGLFKTRYPGVACNVIRASGQVIFQRLVQELQAKAMQGDLMSSNDDGQMQQLKDMSALAPFAPENLKDMVPELRALADKDNYWITSGVSPLVIVYNTKLVTEADAPKNWPDLADPKWKGQVAIGHPSFSGSVGLWTIMMSDLYGWDFFTKIEKNQPQIGRSVADGHNLVVSGERKVALAPLPLILSDAAQKKAPIAVIYPTDGALLPPSATAIMKDAPHPNAARLFENFLLGPEIAELFSKDYRYPLRAGVPLAPGMKPLNSYKTKSIATSDGIKKLPDIQEKFRDTFGI